MKPIKRYTGFKCMKMIYEHILFYEYFIYETCWTLNLLENQSHKSKQVVFQIWGWYLKKLALSKILFGRSTKFSPIDASKTLLVHTVLRFVIYSRVFLSQILQAHTHNFFYDTHTNHTLTSISTHPHNYSCIIYPIGSIICRSRKQE